MTESRSECWDLCSNPLRGRWFDVDDCPTLDGHTPPRGRHHGPAAGVPVPLRRPEKGRQLVERIFRGRDVLRLPVNEQTPPRLAVAAFIARHLEHRVRGVPRRAGPGWSGTRST